MTMLLYLIRFTVIKKIMDYGYLDRVTQAARMNGLKEEYIKNDLLPMSF